MKKLMISSGIALTSVMFGQDGPQNDVVFFGDSEAAVLTAVPALPTLPVAGAVMSVSIGTGSSHARAMKNAPYSAETISESVQVLGDGNKIVSQIKSITHRDSEGRTRQETIVIGNDGAEEKQRMVSIDDPVAEVNYILDYKNKTAMKMEIPKFRQTAIRTAAPAAPMAVKGMSAAPVRMTRRISTFHNEKVNKEDLGTQVMEGVTVKGTRSSFTIPAGQIGNEKEIVSTTEVWISEDLGIPIQTTRTDPRFGNNTTKVSNIQRAEQPASLFEIPSDFKIVEHEMPPMPPAPPPAPQP